MLSKLNIGGWDLYIYTYFIFGVTFIGYYFSPLHLCQAFTLEHINVSTMALFVKKLDKRIIQIANELGFVIICMPPAHYHLRYFETITCIQNAILLIE